MRLPEDLQPQRSKTDIVVIGTVEAGYCSVERRIDYQQLVELLLYIARRSLDIWQAQLPRVLETIAETAKKLLNADAATLHFLYESDQEQEQGRYIYNVFSRGIGKQYLKACPPRNYGLGRQAISEKKYKFIPNLSQGHDRLEMAKLNPKAFAAGVKAMAAFPLLVDGKEGVLYVIFRGNYLLSAQKLRLVELFVTRWAVDAILHTTRFQQMRDEARQRDALHSVTQSLSRIPEDSNLLRRIAWNTLNVLGADVVTIYEYIQTERQFITPPKIAGWLKEEQKMDREIGENNVPFLLIKRGENFYAMRQEEVSIFQHSSFGHRERIKSVAGVLLKVDKDIVGVMFINYRRPHNFSEDEKKVIETLASSAAIAIHNQRWLTARNEINRQIITTLDHEKLLNLIVQQAVKITGADVGVISLFNPGEQKLLAKAKYLVKNIEFDSSDRLDSISIDEGITGWVAKYRQSALVNNVQTDNRYQAYFANIHSELCVPLLDKDSNVFGVLNVESRRISAFNQIHQPMLEALANQAVIGIQNLENKKQLVNMETIATLGDLAGPLVHHMHNDIGAIRVLAKNIYAQGNDYSKKKASMILSLVERVLQGTDRMTSWIKENNNQPINICQIVVEAQARISISPEITLSIDIPDNLPKVLGGEQQLTDVFDNLIQNAVDVMPQRGELSIIGISVQRMARFWVEVRVCDTGMGIVAENIEKIFLPGYTTKDEKRGMGFGLWWTKTYVERLGGYLAVESLPGKGSQFIVLLPVHKPKA
ncbi:GAF domain-containing protein [uncultured Nostoc sp.]|uniref:GAF domain-containing protein n=1 Tax=uncultured Nostoc sp. TaxID=340711 RepID=UPI0026356E24|nr:GAF domain-containing protein [uncultured Nostoc sp.]